jgi:hypothetical protein
MHILVEWQTRVDIEAPAQKEDGGEQHREAPAQKEDGDEQHHELSNSTHTESFSVTRGRGLACAMIT